MQPVPFSAVALSAALGKLFECLSGLWQECINVYVVARFCNIKPCLRAGLFIWVPLTEAGQEAIALALCQQVQQGRSPWPERVTSTWDASDDSAAAKASFLMQL